jgi:glycosyltransferase involved in cell wall biosynthesis
LITRWSLEARVSDRVHILPPLPFDQLVHAASLATVGIVPLAGVDLNYLLGDTNKLHEYLMAGVPVIASDLPEVRRVVTQGEPHVGELFDPTDSSSIAEAYRRVVSSPESYRRRREEARRIARERHHWGVEEQHLVRVYDRLLGSAQAGRSPALEVAI